MLAFLGAVICIIASIAPGSSPGAVPGAGNEAGALLATQGSGGAVQGAETGLGGGAVQGAGAGQGGGAVRGAETGHGAETGQGAAPAPAASSRAPAPGRGYGSDSLAGAPSRFLCLPLAQDCPSPSAREDLLLLRGTADQLRQMVAQQGRQIAVDQRAIRELTGKLSQCEGGQGQGPGSFQNHPEEYAWDLGRNSVEEGAEEESESEQAVLDLERTIHSLKNSIKHLEGELVSRGNASSITLSGAPQGHFYLKIEELEGQLLSKLSELERERALLQNRSDRQRHRVEEQLEALQQRIDHLEKETAAYKLQESYKISLPARTNYMYARMKRSLPELYTLTVCVWLKSKTTAGVGTPFSYAVPGQANEIVFLELGRKPAELLINDKVARLPLRINDGQWHHLCITWTTRDGEWEAYQDGTRQGSGDNLAPWHPIKPGGTLVLGQEQDTAGGRYDASQAFVGELADFNLWDRILTASEIRSIANCSSVAAGNVVSWEGNGIDLFGGASKWPFQRCGTSTVSKED